MSAQEAHICIYERRPDKNTHLNLIGRKWNALEWKGCCRCLIAESNFVTFPNLTSACHVSAGMDKHCQWSREYGRAAQHALLQGWSLAFVWKSRASRESCSTVLWEIAGNELKGLRAGDVCAARFERCVCMKGRTTKVKLNPGHAELL